MEEIEVKFLDIDLKKINKKLRDLGAKKYLTSCIEEESLTTLTEV